MGAGLLFNMKRLFALALLAVSASALLIAISPSAFAQKSRTDKGDVKTPGGKIPSKSRRNSL